MVRDGARSKGSKRGQGPGERSGTTNMCRAMAPCLVVNMKDRETRKAQQCSRGLRGGEEP